MNWLKKNMGFALITVLALIAVVSVIANTSSNGIHNIGNDAVFISGEACVINMPIEMKSEEAQAKFNSCLALHKKYQSSAVKN